MKSIPADKFLAKELNDPDWLIEGIWSNGSHGILAGEPKTRKTYLAVDLAASVATGTPFLGRFPVIHPCPVLMIQEELSDAEIHKRLRQILVFKGCGGQRHGTEGLYMTLPKPCPVHLVNGEGFRLDKKEHMEWLMAEINRENSGQNPKREKKIGLVIIDPLIITLGAVDENSASQVRPILANLLKVKRITGAGVLIVHHYAKASPQNPRVGGQRLLGSQALHGWTESALYISKPDPYVARVEREFRNFPGYYDHFDVEYLGEEGIYDVEISEDKEKKRRKSKPNEFETFCMEHTGKSLKSLAKHLGIAERTMRRRIEKSAYLTFGKSRMKTGARPQTTVRVA